MTIGRRQFVQLAVGAAVLPALAKHACAQAYPARPVKVVVPVAPGGANDTTARLVAQKLSEHFGQQFYCENQVGAGGNIAFAAAAKAPKDGYTILAAGGNFIINPSLYARVPYDPVQRLRAGEPDLLIAACAGGEPFRAGRHHAGVRRAVEGQSRQVQLWLGGQGNAGASCR
jgi:hypothetical protein